MVESGGDAHALRALMRANCEAALGRLVRFNSPGKVSLAGAYALGYGALGFAQHEGDAEDWFDLLDPVDALVLGATFPRRFETSYQFANARDAWLRLLRGTVHWKGVVEFVHLVMQTSDEFDLPVDDGDLMLLVVGRVEGSGLDQRKIPRALLPEAALATSRIAVGPSAAFTLPVPPSDAEDLVGQFWACTDSDLEVPRRHRG